MKTIAYRDLAGGGFMRYFEKEDSKTLFRQKKHERIKEALEDLKHTGNVAIYLVSKYKTRFLYKKSF